MKRFTSVVVMLCYSSCILFSQTLSQPKITPEPYKKEEFPLWTQQLRRSEIITLGSLPFTNLGVMTLYGVFRYIKNDFSPEYIPNPLAKSSSAANLNEKEQKNILIASVSASVLVGIIDFVISLIKQRKAEKNNTQKDLPNSITVEQKNRQAEADK